MASHALLLLAACALLTPLHAASIPDLQKKIPSALPEDIKDPSPPALEIVPQPAEQPTNELRAKPEDIPVEVVVDNEPSIKINEVDDEEIKRPAVDLRNPGPPQRQEHETQNPEQHADEQLKASTIKESIEHAQILLKQSFQDVADNIQSWYDKGDDQNKIQQNIENLREVFTSQISKLRNKIEALVEPEAAESVEPQREASQRNYEQIQSHLKSLEEKFNNDVETLSAGIELVGSLRADAEEPIKDEASESAAAPAPPAPPAPPASTTESAAPPAGLLPQFINMWSQQVNSTLSYLQNLLPNRPGSNTPPSTQADTPSNPGFEWRPPTFINIQNGVTSLTDTFSGFFNNITSFFRPGSASGGVSSPVAEKPTKEKPEAASQPATAADKPAAVEQPAAAAPPAQAAPPAPTAQPDGPIRQFLNSIPVVQRIQNTIANRDTPRNPADKPESQTKGGWFLPPPKPPNHGHNNDVDVGVIKQKSEEVKETVKEEVVKEDPVKEEPIKEEPVKEEPVKEETVKAEPVKEEIKKEEAEIKSESVPEKTE